MNEWWLELDRLWGLAQVTKCPKTDLFAGNLTGQRAKLMDRQIRANR